jgi:hypothetical protein
MIGACVIPHQQGQRDTSGKVHVKVWTLKEAGGAGDQQLCFGAATPTLRLHG